MLSIDLAAVYTTSHVSSASALSTLLPCTYGRGIDVCVNEFKLTPNEPSTTEHYMLRIIC